MLETFRTLLLIAMTLGLFAGQALPVLAGGNCEERVACGKCCAIAGAACCEKAPVAPRSTPPRIAGASVDLKQAIVPVLIRLGTLTELVVPPVAIQKRIFAQQPIQRRLDVTCIRLI